MSISKKGKGKLLSLLKVGFVLFVLGHAVAIFSVSVKYYSLNFSQGFLLGKESLFNDTIYPYGFFGHIATAPFIMVLGLFQFSQQLRVKFPKWHRISGKIYVGLIVFISAPSALIMAYYAKGGWMVQVAFILLSILWWVFTLLAYRNAVKGKFKQHQKNMMRSYVLTLSAIFLRLYFFVLLNLFDVESNTAYTIASWIGWLPHWILLELYLYKRVT